MRLPALTCVSLTIAFAAFAAGVPATAAGASPAPSPAAQTATPSPDEIYSRALHEMRTLESVGQPPYLVYDLQMRNHNLRWTPSVGADGLLTDWNVEIVHANQSAAYRIWYRSSDRRSLMQDATTHAAYVGDAPFVPLTSSLASGATPAPSPSPRSSPAGAASATNDVIGKIAVNGSAHYDITLLGIEQRAGHTVYHLHLRAYRDTEDYPLTDLWVDTGDYRVWAAHGEETVRAVAAALGVGVSVDFSPTDKYFLVSDIDVTVKGYVMLWHANTETVMHATVLSTPSTLPASYFVPQKR